MTQDSEHSRSVRVRNRAGLHARPAAELVKAAANFGSAIWLRKDDMEVNAKSIMGVMMLAAECGSELTIRAIGDDSVRAVDELVLLVEAGFGEELA